MSQTGRDQLLARHVSWALRVAGNVCRRPITIHDDEYSISLLALNEAIDNYCPQRSRDFRQFAGMVIKRRLLDHLRKQQKHPHLSLEVLEESGYLRGTAAGAVAATELLYSDEFTAEELAYEIRRFRQQLKTFGFDLPDLLEATPRHRRRRETLQAVAMKLASNKPLYDKMLQTKRLPIAELSAITGLSRRVLENGRRYIIGIALVLGGDFSGMQAHLQVNGEMAS